MMIGAFWLHCDDDHWEGVSLFRWKMEFPNDGLYAYRDPFPHENGLPGTSTGAIDMDVRSEISCFDYRVISEPDHAFAERMITEFRDTTKEDRKRFYKEFVVLCKEYVPRFALYACLNKDGTPANWTDGGDDSTLDYYRRTGQKPPTTWFGVLSPTTTDVLKGFMGAPLYKCKGCKEGNPFDPDLKYCLDCIRLCFWNTELDFHKTGLSLKCTVCDCSRALYKWTGGTRMEDDGKISPRCIDCWCDIWYHKLPEPPPTQEIPPTQEADYDSG
jgi:hypothetical protein